MLNVVILYSLRHFNPEGQASLSTSSSGLIASEVYSAVIKQPNVNIFYFDAFDVLSWKRIQADILIGIPDNLAIANSFFKPKRTFLIAVNAHPSKRLGLAVDALVSKFPLSALDFTDGVYQTFVDIFSGDAALVVGGEIVRSTFLANDFNSRQIQSTFYSVSPISKQTSSPIVPKSRNSTLNVLIFMSMYSFRKGADVVLQTIKYADPNRYHFSIVGDLGISENSYWRSQGVDILNLKNVRNFGWLDHKSEEFSSIFYSCDLALFPTREEGLAGTVLETIINRLPVLTTPECGFDSRIEKLTLRSLNHAHVLEKLDSLFEAKNSLPDLAHTQNLNLFEWEASLDAISVIVSRWISDFQSGKSDSHTVFFERRTFKRFTAVKSFIAFYFQATFRITRDPTISVLDFFLFNKFLVKRSYILNKKGFRTRLSLFLNEHSKTKRVAFKLKNLGIWSSNYFRNLQSK